jgi:hypothetical protein
MTFGGAANPTSGIAGETLEIPGLPDGNYEIRFFRTWRGLYLDAIAARSTGGVLTVKVPLLQPVGGRVQSMGNDVAFKIVAAGAR